MQRQLLLALTIQGMNDTLGPEGFEPSAIEFGEFTSLRTFLGLVTPSWSLAERIEAAQEARRHMAKHMSSFKLKQALRHNVDPAADRIIQPSDKELIWKERIIENRIGEWVGPYIVYNFDQK